MEIQRFTYFVSRLKSTAPKNNNNTSSRNDLFIIWIYPLPINSRHQDHCITFLVGNPYKPLFAIGIVRGCSIPFTTGLWSLVLLISFPPNKNPLDFNQHDHKKQQLKPTFSRKDPPKSQASHCSFPESSFPPSKHHTHTHTHQQKHKQNKQTKTSHSIQTKIQTKTRTTKSQEWSKFQDFNSSSPSFLSEDLRNQERSRELTKAGRLDFF